MGRGGEPPHPPKGASLQHISYNMGMIKKLPRNPAERRFAEEMAKLGWNLYKKGWPDFLGVKDDKVIFVEVKTKRSHRLKREQVVVLRLLASLGMNCYRWSPDTGLETIHPLRPTSSLALALVVNLSQIPEDLR